MVGSKEGRHIVIISAIWLFGIGRYCIKLSNLMTEFFAWGSIKKILCKDKKD